MFDSLNKGFLPSYGNDWIKAPNFKRLAKNSVQFENSYAGSLPCMPARRELHTGRYNFLHRSWGPLEPFDDSMPEILRDNGIHTHLVSDHHLYWADGGATYHNRYTTWEIIRGQEGDPWKGFVADPEIPDGARAPGRIFLPSREKLTNLWRQEWINRREFTAEEKYPQSQTFQKGMEFIESNHEEDGWFLQIESFDPHEPFLVPEEYDDLYRDKITKKYLDWPDYHPVIEDVESLENLKYKYAALLSKCDRSLGKILDLMDRYNMWGDTMLIVCTDHGFLLGEHDWWAKNMMPAYNEIVNTPLFIWDPRSKKKEESRKALVQFIDLAPTLLEFFNMPIPKDMQGKVLREVIERDSSVREGVLFGWHGNQVNCTDGRYVYMRGASNLRNEPLSEYTLMPTHIKSRFAPDELQDLSLENPFEFTKNCKVMKIPLKGFNQHYRFGTKLFDLKNDPGQLNEIVDYDVEKRMIELMRSLMKESDAPDEQYVRLGIPKEDEILLESIDEFRKNYLEEYSLGEKLENLQWEKDTLDILKAFINLMNLSNKDTFLKEFERDVLTIQSSVITKEYLESFIGDRISEERKPMIMYFLNLLSKRK